MTSAKILTVPVAVWIAFLLFVNVFLAFPQIDLWVSSLFYTPELGFALKGVWWERAIYHSVEYVIAGVPLLLIGIWLFNRLRRQRLLRLDGRRLGFLLALLILVPGLLVNQGLKEHVGRARAIKLEQFGGQDRFTPAFVLSDQEGGSFSSGHAAAGFWLVAVAFCLTRGFGFWTAAALLYAIALGFVRIAAGGHYLSDVLASGFFVLIGWFLLSALIFPAKDAARGSHDPPED